MATTTFDRVNTLLEGRFRDLSAQYRGKSQEGYREAVESLRKELGVPDRYSDQFLKAASGGAKVQELAKKLVQEMPADVPLFELAIAPEGGGKSSIQDAFRKMRERGISEGPAATKADAGDVSGFSRVTSDLADALHADWQATARASGRTERFKPMKENGKAVECQTAAALQAYLDTKGIPAEYRERYRIVEGKVEEDILAIPNRFLATNNRAENDASASTTIALVAMQMASGGSLDAAFIERASSLLHNKWVERNGSWAPEEQKVPFDQLSKVEADKDRDMIKQGIGLLVTGALADALHADWQATARASGRTERFKPMKENGKAVECQTHAELQTYLDSKGVPAEYRPRYRIAEGKVEEDILAIPNRYLAANNRAENDASASVAVQLALQQVASGGKLDATFVEKASSVLHDKWVERNGSWAPAEQKVPFAELTKAEADKDRDMIRLGITYFDAGELRRVTNNMSMNAIHAIR
ncbi:MAG: hypothetical protein HY903_17780 [Deltaproteobacteria bacterium]|nr:hypothetical protein [Deltaproteobacteria bacterium]